MPLPINSQDLFLVNTLQDIIFGSPLSESLTKRAKFFHRKLPDLSSSTVPLTPSSACGSFRTRVSSRSPAKLSPLHTCFQVLLWQRTRATAVAGPPRPEFSSRLCCYLAVAFSLICIFLFLSLFLSLSLSLPKGFKVASYHRNKIQQ